MEIMNRLVVSEFLIAHVRLPKNICVEFVTVAGNNFRGIILMALYLVYIGIWVRMISCDDCYRPLWGK